jgi:ubiquinone/menaquinone biosynthesis C-methylase UbiE
MSLWSYALRRHLLPPLLGPLTARAPKRILEIGCGKGETTAILLERFPDATIVATDVDAASVKKAAEAVTDARVTFAVADATRLPYPDASFDLVIELNSFHHVDRWMTAIAECARVVAPGGAFAAMDENVARWGWLFRLLDRPASTFSSREFVAAARTAGLANVSSHGGERFMRLIFTKPGALSHSPRP